MNKKTFLILGIILLGLIGGSIYFFNRSGTSFVSRMQGASSAGSLLIQAKAEEAKGNFIEAKALYRKLIGEYPNSQKVLEWEKKLEELNLKLLFSSAITAGSKAYEIKPGDSLNRIAREFKTTVELIKKENNLSDDRITPGRKIKVWTAPFSILVDKSQNILMLKANEEVIKTYIVSTGKNNCTPTGTFKIVNKQIDPPWFKSGAGKPIPTGSPENVLGTRWMGFDLAGYGIHGTVDPQSLGKQVTQGCVRLSNPDVEELYIIVPIGTEVTVVD